MNTAASAERELDRIRHEYERRARELPRDLYGWNRPVNLFFHLHLVRAALQTLVREGLFPLDTLEIADIGCGGGSWLLEFIQWGADPHRLHGLDLSEERITAARTRVPLADLRAGDARHLPWADNQFDLISQFTMFTSILQPDMKREIAASIWRTLKPGGRILWYDFRVNNPQNRNVRGIGAAEIRTLFPQADVRLRGVTLAPPIARRLVPLSWKLASLCECVPLLRTHYLGILRKPS